MTVLHIGRTRQFNFDDIKERLQKMYDSASGKKRFTEFEDKCACWREESGQTIYPYWSIVWFYDIGPDGKEYRYDKIGGILGATRRQAHRWKWLGLKLLLDYEPDHADGWHYDDKRFVSETAQKIDNLWRKKGGLFVSEERKIREWLQENVDARRLETLQEQITFYEETKEADLLCWPIIEKFLRNIKLSAIAFDLKTSLPAIERQFRIACVLLGYSAEESWGEEVSRTVLDIQAVWVERLKAKGGVIAMPEILAKVEKVEAKPKVVINEFDFGLWERLCTVDENGKIVVVGRPLEMVKAYVEEAYPNAPTTKGFLVKRWRDLIGHSEIVDVSSCGSRYTYTFLRPDQCEIEYSKFSNAMKLIIAGQHGIYKRKSTAKPPAPQGKPEKTISGFLVDLWRYLFQNALSQDNAEIVGNEVVFRGPYLSVVKEFVDNVYPQNTVDSGRIYQNWFYVLVSKSGVIRREIREGEAVFLIADPNCFTIQRRKTDKRTTKCLGPKAPKKEAVAEKPIATKEPKKPEAREVPVARLSFVDSFMQQTVEQVAGLEQELQKTISTIQALEEELSKIKEAKALLSQILEVRRSEIESWKT